MSTRDQVLFLAIPVTLFTIFSAVPSLLNFGLAFTNWSLYSQTISFNGMANLQFLIDDGTLWKALRITLVYAGLVVIFQNVLGLVAALALEKSTPANSVLRVMIFLPVLLSPLAAGYLFKGLLSSQGIYNQILSFIAGQEIRVEWLGDLTWTIVIVALIQSWKSFGMTALFYIAGLSTVPEELKEAARLDGATWWQAFWQVRWPLLAPAATINIALALIGGLATADYVLATTKGGPAGTTQVLNMLVFVQFGNGALGRSASMTLVLFLVIVILAVPLIIFLRRREQRV